MSHHHIGPNSRYWEWSYGNNLSIFDEKPWYPKGYQTPGHGGDRTYQCFMKFEKWCDRPDKAKMLYWRLHK